MIAVNHHHRHDLDSGKQVTWAAMFTNVALIILKTLGGVFGLSKALLADAAHSFSDLFSDALVLIGLHFFQKEKDTEHPYGHGKVETLATLAVGALLLAAAIRIGIDAALAIYRGDISIPQKYTIPIAAVSIIAKEILYHSTVRIGKRIKSQAMIANAWHHRSDAWTSAITLLGVTLAIYVPSLRVLDSYAALLVSFFIVKVAFDILRGAVNKIIDTSPPPELVERICSEITKIHGVEGCHDLTGRYYADTIQMEVHIEVAPYLTVLEAHEVGDEVVERVKGLFEDVSNILVHIDPFNRPRPPEENMP